MTNPWTMETMINVPMVSANAQQASLLQYIPQHYDVILQKLHEHGAVLFRGFECVEEDYFSKSIAACGLGERCSTADYDFPRTILNENVYTSSDLPGDVTVHLHHEKPRSKEPPHHIYFCCVTPPEHEGGTVFANAAAIWRDIPPTIQDKILQYGVLYQQYFHNDSKKFQLLKKLMAGKGLRSWQDYYRSHDKSAVEEKLASGEAKWEWVNIKKDLRLITSLPGARRHPIQCHFVSKIS
jgi:alpha-ketoglutarate-dependent taurine dioxygenase